MIDDATHVVGNIYCWTDGERFAVGVVASDKAQFVRWGAWPLAIEEEKTVAKNEDLTDREIQTMWLMLEGKPYKQIAAALGIAAGTAKFHMMNSINKLGGKREVAVVRFALMPENIKRARALVGS